MGEYIKYKNKTYKVGTCEDLYYMTRHEAEKLDLKYFLNEECGWRYRFPFRDETFMDHHNDDFNRGVDFIIPAFKEIEFPEECELSYEKSKEYHFKIKQQKMVCNQLQTVAETNGIHYRFTESEMSIITNHIIKNRNKYTEFQIQTILDAMRGYKLKHHGKL